MQRALEWFGLRDSPADDDGLGTYLLGSLGLMLIITTGDESSAARDAWFWIYGIALLALLVGRAQLPERDWRTKAVTGVAATTFTPLGIALILGFEPVGAALVALIGVPALAAGLVVQASRRHASPPRRGR